MVRILVRMWSEESGQDLVEYALVMALIALTCIAGTQALAGGLTNTFLNVAHAIQQAGK